MKSPYRIFMGTEVKFLIDIKSDGFSMHDDDFNITLWQGSTVHVYQKSDLQEETTIVDEQEVHKFYLCFDSALFTPGIVSCLIRAYVPDTSFPDNYRTEVDKFDLVIIDSTGEPVNP